MTASIHIKRAYEPATANDGFRVLVDRLWPRGIAKADLKHDMWCKDLAPSSALRKWFGHKVENWEKFQADYSKELESDIAQQCMDAIFQSAQGQKITLVYGAKDEQHNQAVVLAKFMAAYAKQHNSD